MKATNHKDGSVSVKLSAEEYDELTRLLAHKYAPRTIASTTGGVEGYLAAAAECVEEAVVLRRLVRRLLK